MPVKRNFVPVGYKKSIMSLGYIFSVSVFHSVRTYIYIVPVIQSVIQSVTYSGHLIIVMATTCVVNKSVSQERTDILRYNFILQCQYPYPYHQKVMLTLSPEIYFEMWSKDESPVVTDK